MRFLFVCLYVVFLFICYFFVIVSFLLSVVVVPVNSWFSVFYSNCHFFCRSLIANSELSRGFEHSVIFSSLQIHIALLKVYGELICKTAIFTHC